MKVIKFNEGSVHEAANHVGCWSYAKCGVGNTTLKTNVSISEFLPGGGALMTASTKERVYFLLRGSMDVYAEDGTVYTLNQPEDILYIPPNEKREIKVTGNVAARMLVIITDI